MVSAVSAKKERIYEKVCIGTMQKECTEKERIYAFLKGTAKEKEAVDEQVKTIINLCLEKFSDPKKLMEFAKRIS
jgi:hypothetical protein